MNDSTQRLIKQTQTFAENTASLTFSAPITHVYNPLTYAWEAHKQYLQRYAAGAKRVVFLGMNPGPFGMVQCGIPFGEITTVRDWLGISTGVEKPQHENPKRPIEGFSCQRSEVSGKRLWGLFRERYPEAIDFFQNHFVANYCPLAFLNEGRNITPDKLPKSESKPLYELCDQYLCQVIESLQPEWVIGVGGFAEQRAKQALSHLDLQIGKILHPSPASPAANKGWAQVATAQLEEQGIWE